MLIHVTFVQFGADFVNSRCYGALFGPKGFGRGGVESHVFCNYKTGGVAREEERDTVLTNNNGRANWVLLNIHHCLNLFFVLYKFWMSLLMGPQLWALFVAAVDMVCFFNAFQEFWIQFLIVTVLFMVHSWRFTCFSLSTLTNFYSTILLHLRSRFIDIFLFCVQN